MPSLSIRRRCSTPTRANFVGVLDSPQLPAGEARPSVSLRDQIRIRFIKGVTALAVCFACVEGSGSIAPKQIVDSGDSFHVVRIHTGLPLAQVVDLHTLGNRPNEQFVREPVSQQLLIAKAEPTVTTRSIAGTPDPTRRSALDLLPKASDVVDSYFHESDFTMTTLFTQTLNDATAPTSVTRTT